MGIEYHLCEKCEKMFCDAVDVYLCFNEYCSENRYYCSKECALLDGLKIFKNEYGLDEWLCYRCVKEKECYRNNYL